MSEKVCSTCKKENPRSYQDFCVDLGCSGRLVDKREGLEYVTKLPEGEVCVGITSFKGQVLVATTYRIYRLGDDEVLEPLKFKLDPQDTPDDFACPECNGTFRYDGVHHKEEGQWGGGCDECGFTSMFDSQPPLADDWS